MRPMRALLDLLLPPHCAGCGREGAVLCADCAKPLRRRLGEPAGVPIGLPALMPSGLVQLEWCAMFSGSVREAIHALKYGGERRLTGPLAAAMAERWLRAGVGSDLVTWVPVHETRRRERGFDQAQELARSLTGSLRLPVAACLERHQRTAAQHALDRQQRAASTAGVFHVPGPCSRHGGRPLGAAGGRCHDHGCHPGRLRSGVERGRCHGGLSDHAGT